jgi:phosphatidylglycerol:prolipoprotein diacylglycerol transferase
MMDPRVAFYLFDKNGIAIHWYGIIIAVGLILGVVLGVREAKRRGYRSEMVLDLLLIAIPLCIVCARLYYVIFSWNDYANNFGKVFAVWEGGLAIYGAVIGGVIAAFIFNRWRKVPVGELLDIAAPGLIIGQAIGRWGNFVNQEAFGNLVTDPSMQSFPYSVYIDRLGEWHQATFFYESMWNLVTFAILMIFRKRIKVRGGVFALYIVFYGIGRFFIESLRTDSLMAGDVRVSQWLSAILVVCGIAYLIIMSKKKKEYLAYDGLYSLSWTDEQVAEYKKSRMTRQKTVDDLIKNNDEPEEAEEKKDDGSDNKEPIKPEPEREEKPGQEEEKDK